MSEQTLSRNEEIQQIHKDYIGFYQLGSGLFLVLIGVFIGAVIFSEDSGYGTNIYTEILSVGLTILVLNGLQERRDTRNRIKDLQEQLVREAGSPIHATAVPAVDTIRKRGWLGRKRDIEALLKNANLSNSDLHNANLGNANLISSSFAHTNLSSTNLRHANLTYANLWSTNLINADMRYANLISTNLSQANLTDAKLMNANLTSADMSFVNLTSANLVNVNLSNAYLRGANLTDATLFEANLNDTLIQKSTTFDESTILPDGSSWSEGRNLAEFGAETRKIVDESFETNTTENPIISYTFADGIIRRYQYLKGWLDDRDGDPIVEE